MQEHTSCMSPFFAAYAYKRARANTHKCNRALTQTCACACTFLAHAKPGVCARAPLLLRQTGGCWPRAASVIPSERAAVGARRPRHQPRGGAAQPPGVDRGAWQASLPAAGRPGHVCTPARGAHTRARACVYVLCAWGGAGHALTPTPEPAGVCMWVWV